ncbi:MULTISPECIES: diaminopimelate decarboxylase [unclassified Neptuniibacter]|uniref:diaminopimelate decarboxylase n=1 Tax=unclassified Neptuniibacter TaxID=2630693 RepID=UPI000C5BFA9B|nr:MULTISPECIES: diaminopimelate decarboxylase [unclassified Neptuniibacter]MAY42955.1 diaminopimelate decarboxylase [Oceanospirillaceae bacterium]|tara:strand:- start:4311 stop:5567 length:1257 start_codon:yes stop_codon:yes gene_type:complete
MDTFEYRNEQLCCEEVALTRIAEEHGTPTYVYSRDAIERVYLAYAEALEGRNDLVCYAVKANSNIAVLNVLARLGAGFDIVSAGELERVLRAGGDASKVVFSGVGKQPHEIVQALDAGIRCFNIESESELERVNAVAESEGKVAAISFRVNPDVDAGTHPYISTGLKENKFGIDIDDAVRIYQRAADMKSVDVVGMDCHIGSQLTEVAPFLDAMDRVLVLVDTLAEQGIAIKHLDLGGGLGVCYTDEVPPTPQEYIAAVLEKLGERDLELIFEPGRSIAANAGVMLTRVEFLKCTGEKNFAIIDGAMNDLIRPALYSAYQEIIPVMLRDGGETKAWDLVGPVCETGDFLGKDRQLNLEPSDLLAVCSAGAYGFVMASNYNSRGRPAEVMVDDSQYHLIRKRESVADLIRGEQLLPKDR